jgi:carotenoid cleavage dioxygenase-like enzyme
MIFDVEEERTKLAVLTADSLETVAVLALPHATRLGFHGTFVRDADLRG